MPSCRRYMPFTIPRICQEVMDDLHDCGLFLLIKLLTIERNIMSLIALVPYSVRPPIQDCLTSESKHVDDWKEVDAARSYKEPHF